MNWGLALIVGGVVLALIASPFVLGRFIALGDKTPAPRAGRAPAAPDERK